MPATLTPEEQVKVDAWVLAVRQLARQHRCAHLGMITYAVKVARRTLVSETIPTIIGLSSRHAQSAGIPEEELNAVRALLFG